MGVIDKFKNMLFKQDTINYEFIIKEMKERVENLKKEYKNLIIVQNDIILNPKSIMEISFAKKEKYIEIMDKIKYKDINLIQEFELYAMKYNILVELYIRLKRYVSDNDEVKTIVFQTDKYKQPVAIISHNVSPLNKIILIKNTLSNFNFIQFELKDNISITDIYSQEPNVNHGVFMMQMLLQLAYELKQKDKRIKNIIVSDQLIKKMGLDKCRRFFYKFGFEFNGSTIIKSL